MEYQYPMIVKNKEHDNWYSVGNMLPEGDWEMRQYSGGGSTQPGEEDAESGKV